MIRKLNFYFNPYFGLNTKIIIILVMSSSLYRGAVTTEVSTGVVSLLGQTGVGGGRGGGVPWGTIEPQLQVLGFRP